MKTQELEEKFAEFVREIGFKADRSRFEGEGENRKYITAKPYTLFLDYADRRIGRRVKISRNGPKGRVTSITHSGYLTYSELYHWMDGVLWQFLING